MGGTELTAKRLRPNEWPQVDVESTPYRRLVGNDQVGMRMCSAARLTVFW